MAQSDAFTAAQRAALSPNQFAKLTFSPLVLDLDGDGVETIGVYEGVEFDLAGLGRPHPTGWVAPDDGLLVMDRNGNGRIDDGSELFGTATKLADGRAAADGFEALAEQDFNRDGRITAADPNFERLKVWVDADRDGMTDPGELRGLVEMGIAALNLDAVATDRREHDNLIGLVADYETVDGRHLEMADVWFRARPPQDAAMPSMAELLAGPADALPAAEASATDTPASAEGSDAGTPESSSQGIASIQPGPGDDEAWIRTLLI
jgi:hypothetical protein